VSEMRVFISFIVFDFVDRGDADDKLLNVGWSLRIRYYLISPENQSQSEVSLLLGLWFLPRFWVLHSSPVRQLFWDRICY